MKMRVRIGWMGVVLLVGVAGVVACSSNDDKDDGDGEETAPKSGSVTVMNQKFVVSGIESGSYQATASFLDTSGVSGGGQSGNKCETSKEGGCTLVLCPSGTGTDAGPPPSGDAGAVKVAHAGQIDITGASDSPIKLEPLSDGQYKPAQGGKSIWAGGEELKIHAAGNSTGVGSFDGALKAPSNIKVTSPSWGATALGPTIDRTKDLELAWSLSGGSASGEIQTTISGAGVGNKSVVLTCTSKVADNKAKIPASLLGKLEAAPANYFTYTVEKSTQTVSSDWKVTLALQSMAAREGGLASGLATVK